MEGWNVVASASEGGFRDAITLLARFGDATATDFYNVLVLEVEDIPKFLEALRQDTEREQAAAACLSHVVPVTRTFDFESSPEFRQKAKVAVLPLLKALAGKKFHVRMRRRGLKGRLRSVEEEQYLDGMLLAALQKAGLEGEVDFEDPDVIVAVETVGARGGISLWTREDLERYPFLRID